MGERDSSGQGPAIVVPIFDDWPSLQRLAEGLANQAGPRPRLIVVDDGSVQPGPDLAALARPGLCGEVVRLRRNAGHQAAIAAGLCHAAGNGEDVIVVMDGDGEDRPEDVGRLIAALPAGEPASVAVATRGRRHASFGFRLFYRLYGATFLALTGRRLGFGNFCALSPAAARRLTRMPELRLHLAAAILRSGIPVRRLPIDRGHRFDGRSKMSFIDLTSHSLRSIAVFSETVLTRVVIAAFLIAAVGALILAIVFAAKLTGHASPGWATSVGGVILIVVSQIAMTGLLGLFVILRGQRADLSDGEAAARSLIERVEAFGSP